jgi:hypothetical protein
MHVWTPNDMHKNSSVGTKANEEEHDAHTRLAVVKHLIRAAEIEAVSSCIETEG